MMLKHFGLFAHGSVLVFEGLDKVLMHGPGVLFFRWFVLAMSDETWVFYGGNL